MKIANVAVRAILDRPAVGGVILGVRLGEAEHIAENLQVFAIALDAEDHARIAAVVRRARDLFAALRGRISTLS